MKLKTNLWTVTLETNIGNNHVSCWWWWLIDESQLMLALDVEEGRLWFGNSKEFLWKFKVPQSLNPSHASAIGIDLQPINPIASLKSSEPWNAW